MYEVEEYYLFDKDELIEYCRYTCFIPRLEID